MNAAALNSEHDLDLLAEFIAVLLERTLEGKEPELLPVLFPGEVN